MNTQPEEQEMPEMPESQNDTQLPESQAAATEQTEQPAAIEQQATEQPAADEDLTGRYGGRYRVVYTKAHLVVKRQSTGETVVDRPMPRDHVEPFMAGFVTGSRA